MKGDIVALPLAGVIGCRNLRLTIHAEGGSKRREIGIEVQVHRCGSLHAASLGDGLVVLQVHQQDVPLGREGVGVLRHKHRAAQQACRKVTPECRQRSILLASRSGSSPSVKVNNAGSTSLLTIHTALANEPVGRREIILARFCGSSVCVACPFPWPP